MEHINPQFGPYRLYEKIGSGGFATVYLARDMRTNTVVAVKVLRAQYAEDSNFVARFQREAESLRKLPDHPNIVRLHEFGRQSLVCYIAMEYLEGPDLAQILAKRIHLETNDAALIALQIARALDVAYQHGLIHRDIKPENVKITPEGMVKVMDFGLARAAEEVRLTMSGTYMGTPDYMAPEIWDGKPADIRSDIYSLGILFYEMLVGKPPFQRDALGAVMHGHLMEQPRSIRSAGRNIPADLEAIVFRMMAKKPQARFQTPAEIVSSLTQWLTQAGFDVQFPSASIRILVAKLGGSAGHPLPDGKVSSPVETVKPPGKTLIRPVEEKRKSGMLPLGILALAILGVVSILSALSIIGQNGTLPSATQTPIPIAAIVTAASPTSTPIPIQPPASTVTLIPTAIPVSRTVTVLSTVTVAPTATNNSTSTVAPTPTNYPKSTTAPTITPPAVISYPAPVITNPDLNTTLYPGEVLLTWDFQQPIGDDEWFEVLGWKEGNTAKNSVAWVKDRSYRFRLTPNNRPDWVAGLGQYYLVVKVIRGKDGRWLGDLSKESNLFRWRW